MSFIYHRVGEGEIFGYKSPFTASKLNGVCLLHDIDGSAEILVQRSDKRTCSYRVCKVNYDEEQNKIFLVIDKDETESVESSCAHVWVTVKTFDDGTVLDKCDLCGNYQKYERPF